MEDRTTKHPKRYYWLRLNNNYFNQLEQKKMKRCEHGKDMQVIYLRMMLLSIDKGGMIYYQGVYDTLEEELAEEFDEPVQLIKETLDFLISNGMATIDQEDNCLLPEAVRCIGSECYSAERVRRHRQNTKELQCNNDVTDSNVTVTPCNEEIEIELESEKQIEKNIELKIEKSNSNISTDVLAIIKAWNNLEIHGIRKIVDIKKGTNRFNLLSARLKQYSISDILTAIDNIKVSPFLCGSNDNGWTITFDWFIKPNNFPKVLEGNYCTWNISEEQQLKNISPADMLRQMNREGVFNE